MPPITDAEPASRSLIPPIAAAGRSCGLRLSADLVDAELELIVSKAIAESQLPDDIVREAVRRHLSHAMTELFFLARLAA